MDKRKILMLGVLFLFTAIFVGFYSGHYYASEKNFNTNQKILESVIAESNTLNESEFQERVTSFVISMERSPLTQSQQDALVSLILEVYEQRTNYMDSLQGFNSAIQDQPRPSRGGGGGNAPIIPSGSGIS